MNTELTKMVELNDAELDAVSAGAPQGQIVGGGLAGVGVQVGDVDVEVEVERVLNDNQIALLGFNRK